MKAITEALDAYLSPKIGCNLSPEPNVKLWGLAELINKSGSEKFPWTVNGREAVKLDNQYDIIVYHRVLDRAQGRDDLDESWGLKIAKRFSPRLRTVLAYKVSIGEDFYQEFANLFPTTLIEDGNDNRFVDFVFNGVDLDHDAIFNEEWPNEDPVIYGKHRVTWNVCAIEHSVEFIKCEVC